VGNGLADHEAITLQEDDANFDCDQHTPRVSASQRVADMEAASKPNS
jgi:hypothetical protein